MVAYDLRPFIEAIEVDKVVEAVLPTAGASTITVRMTLRHDPERGVGRTDELLAALSERAGAAIPHPIPGSRAAGALDPTATGGVRGAHAWPATPARQ